MHVEGYFGCVAWRSQGAVRLAFVFFLGGGGTTRGGGGGGGVSQKGWFIMELCGLERASAHPHRVRLPCCAHMCAAASCKTASVNPKSRIIRE
jgi:hypothetical protein